MDGWSTQALCEFARGQHASARMMLSRCLREPLLHFLLIGSLLFVIYGAWGHSNQPGSKRVELTLDDLRQLQMGFAAQWERQPTPEELSGLAENRVREQILYREALAMGLDKDDEIVQRRMAQKMQFLAEDVSNAHEPTTAELKAWFVKNSAQFALPGRFSFRHLYFSPDRRGQQAHDDAIKALANIRGEGEQSKVAAALADRFMFRDYYADRTPEELEKEFGSQFAAAIQKLKPGSWQGPVESGYGWHLVFVDSVITGRIPVFEEVEPDVKTAWLADQKQQARQKAYEEMRAKYSVVLPGAVEQQSANIPSKPTEIPALSSEGPP